MKHLLIVVFVLILVAMSIVTVRASLERHVLDNGKLMSDLWFQATLCDAYCGFVTFFCWVAYKERAWIPRLVWFMCIMILGNFAMAAYVLNQLIRLPPHQDVSSILFRAEGVS